MKALTYFIQVMLLEKKDIFLSILAGFIAGVSAVGLFSSSGFLISQAALTPPIYTLMVVVAIIKLLGIISAVSKYGERYYSHRATFTMLSNIRLDTFKKLENRSHPISTDYKSGDLLSRVVGDVESLQNLLLRVIYPPIVMMAVFFATVIFTSFFSVGTALLLVAGFFIVLLCIPILFFIGHKSVDDKVRDSRGHLSTIFTEFIYGYRELIIHQSANKNKEKVISKIKEYEDQNKKVQLIHLSSDAAISFTSLLVSVAVLIYGSFQVVQGNLPGVLLAMLLMISLTIFEQINPMALFPYYLQENIYAAKRLETLNENQRSIQKELIVYKGDTAPEITFSEVSFIFDNQVSPALESISFTLRRGSKTAVIGASGSGKTTIANLLLNLVPYQSGTITFNGIKLSSINEQQLWEHTNISMQSNDFFFGTIEENLRLAHSHATNNQMIQALEEVELSHMRLDTFINEKGSNLSGGEKQRLALARLFLRRASLWVLDEPTSSLDSLTEKRMLNLVKQKSEQDTVVLISHRLTGLEEMDQILVVDNGKIIENGTYQELINQNGYFKRMKDLENQLFNP